MRRVPARVGLVGNPSDGHGGAVLATVLAVPAADVIVAAGAGVRIGDRVWPSMEAWQTYVADHGHRGDDRLVHAALWTVVDHLADHLVDGLGAGFIDGLGADRMQATAGLAIGWSTGIPRSVGLAGSSALAVGVIDAVAARWGVTLDRRVLAALALRAERDVLGIAAGWQDRIAQAIGCTVLVDAAAMEVVDGIEVPSVHAVGAPGVGVGLVVGWSVDGASESDAYHGPLRARSSALAGPMHELAALARVAADGWAQGDVDAVGAAMDAGWSLRQRHVPLREDHAALVEAVRSAGLPATTPGSGGSVVAVCVDGAAATRAEAALAERGCATCRVVVR